MKFLKKSLLTAVLAIPVLFSPSSHYNTSLMGALNRNKIVDVTIQEHNKIYNENSGCLESEYMVYWNPCECDGTYHYRAVGWRRAEGNRPYKNGEWYEARILSKNKEPIVVRSKIFIPDVPTFYDRETEDRKKHPIQNATPDYNPFVRAGEIQQQKFKRILDPTQ